MDKLFSVRGKLFWKERWFSICSAHIDRNPDCAQCDHGHWVNVFSNRVQKKIFNISPKIWKFFYDK